MSPTGIYEHPRGYKRTSKAAVMDFVRFCFRDDIADRLADAHHPHKLAVELYHTETGITISPALAYRQRGRWRMVNDIIYRIRD